jgi:hypothetical protein
MIRVHQADRITTTKMLLSSSNSNIQEKVVEWEVHPIIPHQLTTTVGPSMPIQQQEAPKVVGATPQEAVPRVLITTPTQTTTQEGVVT